MPIVTRGWGIDGGTGFGARLLTHSIDVFAIAKPFHTYSFDLVVAPAVIATQFTETYSADLVVGDFRTARYDMDVLVYDLLMQDEGWGENYV